MITIMEENVDFTDEDIEIVVCEMFKNIDPSANRISSKSALELVSAFVRRNGSEYDLLENFIDKMSVNGEIDKANLKSAISEWVRSLRVNEDSDLLDNPDFRTSLFVSNRQYEEININFSNHGSRAEYVEELEKKLAFKENLITNLKAEVQHLSQQIQVHEELYRTVVSEKNQLIEKNQKNQFNSISYDEYNELIESFQILKESKEQLQQKIDSVKSENNNLYKNISLLENERLQLSYLLKTTKKEKEKISESLFEAKSFIEELKNDCIDLNDKILEQETVIKDLMTTKECLELELNTVLSKNNSGAVSLKNYRDNSSESKIFDETNNKSLALELKALNYPITSTPCNNASLLQELKVDDNFTTYTVNEIEDTYWDSRIFKDVQGSISNITSDFQSRCSNEVIVKNFPLTVSLLKDQIDTQQELNSSISDRCSDDTNVILSLKSEIDNLNQMIVNMKECISVSDMYCHSVQNAMRNVNTKTKTLLYLMKENCIWIGEKHNSILKHLKSKTSISNTPETTFTQAWTSQEKRAPEIFSGSTGSYNTISYNAIRIPRVVRKSTVYSRMKSGSKYLIIAFVFFFLIINMIFYGTMKYCNCRGNKFYILPWSWINVDEFLLSIFKFHYEGRVPT